MPSPSALLLVASIPLLVAAHLGAPLEHAARHVYQGRQAAPAAPAASSVATGTTSVSGAPPTSTIAVSGSPAASTVSSGTGTASGVSVSNTGTSVISGVTAPPTLATTFTFTLQSTNPTAVPLTAINANATTIATIPLDTTVAPGATPTFLTNAPPLPNAALLAPANYPPLDKPPPTDSPEVQQWIAEVNSSGVNIPNIAPTVAGGCPANAAAAADTSRCWWTCGGCTRESDVTECPTPMTWGLTYDDGPAYYTPNLLNFLDQQSLKSTFFVVGSRVISFPAMLQSQYMSQHQIAVHTWSHPSLTTLTTEEIIAELGWSKKVIKDVLGVTPNMMRPPFGDIDDRVRAISIAMGLTPVMWTRISPLATFDTDDFNIHSGLTSVQQVLQNWENILGNVTTLKTGFIVLEHDLFQQSVEVATGYILPDALAHQPKFNITPVISCLNKTLSDAYIETNDNTTNPPLVGANSGTSSVFNIQTDSVVSTASAGTASASASAAGTTQGTSSGISLAVDAGMALAASVFGVAAGMAAVL